VIQGVAFLLTGGVMVMLTVRTNQMNSTASSVLKVQPSVQHDFRYSIDIRKQITVHITEEIHMPDPTARVMIMIELKIMICQIAA
jgi:hypothetical protein